MPVLSDINDDASIWFLLNKQQGRYEEIKKRSEQIITRVLSVVSLIVSLGVIQYILSGGVESATLKIPDELANFCSPEGVEYGNVFVNLGGTNFLFGSGLIVLAAYLIIGMWHTNSQLHDLRSLGPNCEPDLLIHTSSEWLEKNEAVVQKAQQLLEGIHMKLRYSVMFTSLGSILIVSVYLNWTILLILINIFWMLLYPIVFFVRIRRHYLRGNDKSIVGPAPDSLPIITYTAFSALWIVMIVNYHELFSITYYLYCW